MTVTSEPDDPGNSPLKIMKDYTYDTYGNIEIVNVTGYKGTAQYIFNAFGDLISQTDAGGKTLTMTYDILGRMKTETAGAETFSWSYDTRNYGRGMPAHVEGPEGYDKSFFYGEYGRPQKVYTTLDNSYSICTYYDSFGRVKQVDYPYVEGSSFRVNYHYNENGYLDYVYNESNPSQKYWQATEMDEHGQVTDELLGNGLRTQRTFNPATGILSNILTKNNGGNTRQDLFYDFDSAGNLLTRVDSDLDKSEDFTYDSLNRLISVNGPTNKSYNYNAIGNVMSRSDVGDYTYGQGMECPHAVTNAGGVSYGYDSNGNMISDTTGRGVTYNDYNRPVHVFKPGVGTARFVYDEAEQVLKQNLISEGCSKFTTTWYIGGIFEHMKTTQSGSTVHEYKHYIQAGGSKIAVHTKRSTGPNNTYYLLKDHLGSTDKITDEGGNIVESMSYAAFGERRNASTWADVPAGTITSDITDHGFTGHLHLDLFGLIHMQGRIYDPYIGRFLSPDPFVKDYHDPQSLNRYSYCRNNPLKYTDPSGYIDGWSSNTFLDVASDLMDAWDYVCGLPSTYVYNPIIRPSVDFVNNNIVRPGVNFVNNNIVDPTTDTISIVWEGVTMTADDVGQWAAGIAQQGLHTAQQQIQTQQANISQVATNISSAVSNTAQQVASTTENAVNDLGRDLLATGVGITAQINGLYTNAFWAVINTPLAISTAISEITGINSLNTGIGVGDVKRAIAGFGSACVPRYGWFGGPGHGINGYGKQGDPNYRPPINDIDKIWYDHDVGCQTNWYVADKDASRNTGKWTTNIAPIGQTYQLGATIIFGARSLLKDVGVNSYP